MRTVAGSGVDPGVIRLEFPVSVAERLSLVGRLSEVLTIALTSPTGARFPRLDLTSGGAAKWPTG